MTIMTNFRAQDMPGNQKPVAAPAPAPVKKTAAKKTVTAPVVEAPVEEVVVEEVVVVEATEEAPAE